MKSKQRKKILKRFSKQPKTDYTEIIKGILKRKDFVISTFNGGALYSNKWTYVIVSDDIVIGHDMGGVKTIGTVVNKHELALFIQTLNYYVRL